MAAKKKSLQLTPIVMTADREDALVSEIESQLADIEKVDSAAWEYWEQLSKLYYLKPETEKKNFPFPDSSNVVVPTIPVQVDGKFSRINNAVFGGTDLVMVESLRSESQYVNAATKMARYMERRIYQGPLNIYKVWNDGFMSDVKFGTSVFESDYVNDVRTYPSYDNDGNYRDKNGKPIEREVILYQGPRLTWFPLEHFRMTVGYWDPQTSPLVGRKLDYSNDEFLWSIERRVFKDILKDLDGDDRAAKAASIQKQSADNYEISLADKLHRDLVLVPHHEIYRLWMSFDILGTGTSQEIALWYHRGARRILNCYWNYLRPMRRPFHVEHDIVVEGKLYGIGAIERGKGMADEINAIHRQTIDAARLANTVGIVAKEGLRSQLGNIWMGKFITTNNPREDIEIHPMGQVNAVSLPLQQAAQAYQNQAVGLQDIQQGSEPAGKSRRPVARDTLARLQEAKKRIDCEIRDIRESKSRQLEDLFLMDLQFSDFTVVEDVLGPDDAKDLQFIWMDRENSLDNFRRNFGFQITTSSAAMNKEMELQVSVQANQMLSAFNDRGLKMMQTSMQLQNPALKQKLADQYKGERDLTVRSLEMMGVLDADKKVADLSAEIGGSNAGGSNQPGVSGQPQGGVQPAQGQPGVPNAPGGIAGNLPLGGGLPQ